MHLRAARYNLAWLPSGNFWKGKFFIHAIHCHCRRGGRILHGLLRWSNCVLTGLFIPLSSHPVESKHLFSAAEADEKKLIVSSFPDPTCWCEGLLPCLCAQFQVGGITLRSLLAPGSSHGISASPRISFALPSDFLGTSPTCSISRERCELGMISYYWPNSSLRRFCFASLNYPDYGF